MAANFDDGANQAAPSAASRAGLEPQRPAPQPQVTGRALTGSGVNDLPALLRKSPVGLSGYGEAVKKLATTVREIIKAEAGDDTDIKVHVLDAQQRGTTLSAVAISQGTLRGTQSFAAVHTLIVEGSAGRLQKIVVNQGTQPLEITATAGDTYNNAMWDKIKALVAESYPVGTIIRDAQSTAIPTEMDLTDAERVRKVLFYAIQSVHSVLEQVIGVQPEAFSVGLFTRNDRVTAKIDFTPQPVETTTGMPIRSDVSIVLNACNTQVNQMDFMPTAGKDFSRVDGYVDLVYTQPPQPAYGQPPETRHYHPRFVITNFAPLLEGVNLELLLLALSSATLLSRSDNYAWGGVFRPKFGADLNLRDIGAIGYEIPALVGSTDGKGGKIDTQASTWTNDSLYQLLLRTVFPRLIYAFDVEESGSLSNFHLPFITAAAGDAVANQQLVDAANRLTDGKFNHHFTGGPIVVEDGNRVHLGYYIDGKGNKRDIRELDYLAVLNMTGKNDPVLAAKWANTFDRTDIDLLQRLDERERMLTSLIGQGSYRITGYARRIMFTPNFVGALGNALHDAGLSIQPGNQAFFFDGQMVRGNDAISQFAFGGPGVANLFSMANQAVRTNQIQHVSSRFGR